MEFWNSLLTEKSWKILLELKKQPFHFIVIGGWAAYLWTKQHKSKDIDIVIPDIKDLDILKTNYDLRKNDRLKKYEIHWEEIDIDIYVPWYSVLTIPVEDIKKYTTKIEGIHVVSGEALLILKQGAEEARQGSVKGQKDCVDIMTLLCYASIDLKKYNALLKVYHLEYYRQRLKQIVSSFQEITYLNINANDFAKKKRELLKPL